MGPAGAARRLSDAACRQAARRDTARSALTGFLQRVGEIVRGAPAWQRLWLAGMRRPAGKEQDLESCGNTPVYVGEPLSIEGNGAGQGGAAHRAAATRGQRVG